MSLSMLRYFIMGLKKYTGYCKNCKKKLLIPTWHICEDCDPNSFRNVSLRTQLMGEQIKLEHTRRAYWYEINNRKNINKASVLLLDENGSIIGYKM
jgi:hypothetical protein